MSLRRRSQKARLSWEKFIRLVARFFPPIKTLHPLPSHRSSLRRGVRDAVATPTFHRIAPCGSQKRHPSERHKAFATTHPTAAATSTWPVHRKIRIAQPAAPPNTCHFPEFSSFGGFAYQPWLYGPLATPAAVSTGSISEIPKIKCSDRNREHGCIHRKSPRTLATSQCMALRVPSYGRYIPPFT
jgi:hypothetical protein